MKKTLFFIFLLCSIFTLAQKQIYSSPNLSEKIRTQKTVAILPFTTTITYKKTPKKYDAEANHDQELKMAKNIQSSMYTFLLRKADKYSVSFQDVDQTNILLKKAGVEDQLDGMTKDEIAKVLNVDAVISGKFDQIQSRSEAGAIVTTVLFGGLGSKTGSGTLTMTINSGDNGELLWRFMKTMDDTITISTDQLVESMMRKVSRNFPYTKS